MFIQSGIQNIYSAPTIGSCVRSMRDWSGFVKKGNRRRKIKYMHTINC